MDTEKTKLVAMESPSEMFDRLLQENCGITKKELESATTLLALKEAIIQTQEEQIEYLQKMLAEFLPEYIND